MEKQELLYEGKAKQVYATQDPGLLIVAYKDDATAFDGRKRGTIQGKGAINNRMTNLLMARLEREGIPTHLVEELSGRETLVKKVSIVPLEVIVRNIAAGSFSKRYGVEEGLVFNAPTLEFSYKNDALGDPLLNDDHAVALGLVFGYVALRTGCLWQTILLHAMVNFIATGLIPLLELWGDWGEELLGALILGSIFLGVVFLIVRRRELRAAPGQYGLSQGRTWRLFFENPGVIVFCLLALLESLSYFL